MNFKDLLIDAKIGVESAIEKITEMYKPLLLKESTVEGVFDEDLYQELWMTLLDCVRKIKT